MFVLYDVWLAEAVTEAVAEGANYGGGRCCCCFYHASLSMEMHHSASIHARYLCGRVGGWSWVGKLLHGQRGALPVTVPLVIHGEG